MFNEVKIATTSTNQLFWWYAPEPLFGTGDGNLDPELTIRHPALGNTTLALSGLVSGAAERTITAVAADRRTLTMSGTVAIYSGASGSPLGTAFFITPSDGVFDVEVRRASGSTITLAEPLPAPVTVNSTTSGVLQWAAWSALVPASYLATPAVNVPWHVMARTQFGSGIGNFGLIDEGLVHFVRQPFRTGLTSKHLLQAFPGLAGRVPRRQGSFDAQIDVALAELIHRLRANLAPRGLTEDDVGGHRLRLVHSRLALAVIYDETQPEKAAELRDAALGPVNEKTGRRAGGLVDEALRDLWVDADADGVVNDGEVSSLEGNRGTDNASFFTSSSYSSSTRRFTYGERH